MGNECGSDSRNTTIRIFDIFYGFMLSNIARNPPIFKQHVDVYELGKRSEGYKG